MDVPDTAASYNNQENVFFGSMSDLQFSGLFLDAVVFVVQDPDPFFPYAGYCSIFSRD